MKDKLIPFLVVLVVAGAFAVGLLYGKVSVYEKGGTAAGTQQQGGSVAQGNEAQPQAPPEEVQLTDDLWKEMLVDPAAEIGEANATVTMVEFTDYQCPFCGRYYTDTFGTIMSDYVDTGKVRYVLRDLPLSFHQNAKPAALAARCAGDQGKYVEMHDKMFEGQQEWSSGDPAEIFAGYAGDLGLNVGTFSSCYDADKYGEAIDNELALANKVGATGTPTFFINGTKLVGAQPLSVFQAALDEALGE